jgi:dienelactone hydrolase
MEEISIPINKQQLKGNLVVPEGAKAIILFAHGSGSSRFSPRNQYVAKVLNDAGLATLLFDLLTEREEEIDEATGALRFDIDLLAYRLVKATEWILQNPKIKDLKIGYFGASTGAAATLIAAAAHPEWIYAIVSRGGRPDLARDSLPAVVAPTLLIVGELDTEVIELNKEAISLMSPKTENHLELVPGATHLFEEPGALEQGATKAKDWFIRYL